MSPFGSQRAPRVALVTCQRLPEPDPDESLMLAALRAGGCAAEMLAWDDPEAEAGPFDLAVLRSCWNYYRDPTAFAEWLEAADRATRVLNPVAVVRWNLHKGYLRELEERGLAVVPTAYVARGEPSSFEALLERNAWADVVVKPAISAASFHTKRFRAPEAASGQEFLETLSRERDVLVQPYMRSFEREGERALVWIDGELTHAVRKSPRFAGGEERVSDALEVTEQERELAAAALSGLEEELLYARIDVIRDDEGALRISELELIEPSLFLLQSPAALARFVEAVQRRFGGGPSPPARSTARISPRQ